MKRDHTDHIEDAKQEQSFAGLGIDVPNNEGSTNNLPNVWIQDVWLTLIHSLEAARPEEDKV